ncbi:MAG: M20/M25/M40 family metallo-hydrolase [Pseudomonadales bacterium]|nr:M20/M25/M40 family metallo-hydrolase [Pseudomonadales bacterium]MBO6564831.1 M20/M25/M40 family metallo-hydrolase [Pseudomonadales bacterium]MBO6595522.1 M20/M25/M40 family metallo-hydrolase [Pseudomonadales bacterium]MBO6657070.1 M20/M25/M40 family metallo-hydrolase [Pseudomonadales bacterium]MBO6702022.1 M20/M25/M40 family metallo-hydrolase [Pseudomonadales bacterium]
MRVLLALVLCCTGTALAERTEHEQFAFELFKALIESDTTHATGDTLTVSNTIADRLRSAGVPDSDVVVVEYGGKGNLVARLRADKPSEKPLLLLAHLDVVAANPLDWSVDPKKLTEKDGYYYARGTLDVKNEASMHLANFVRIHRQQLPLKRDIILALTADEESGPHNGALHLIREHRDLVDAGLVINEGGGGLIKDGKYIANTVQTAEKTYQSYRLEITNPGGHSSLPRKDNAIYELAEVLRRIEAHEFPVRLNDTTRAYFAGVAETAEEQRASMLRGLLEEPPSPESVAYFRNEPAINARLRTTCVATQVLAGHAENALPQRASAMINCRVFPGVPVADIEKTLREVADMPGLEITRKWDSLFSDASPLQEEIMKPIREITEDMFPGVIVLPTMSTGATDSTFFRSAGIPVYGVSGVFTDMDDNRRHGRDERIRVQSFYEGLEFLDRLTRAVAVDQ